jgi:hypothetical protein
MDDSNRLSLSQIMTFPSSCTQAGIVDNPVSLPKKGTAYGLKAWVAINIRSVLAAIGARPVTTADGQRKCATAVATCTTFASAIVAAYQHDRADQSSGRLTAVAPSRAAAGAAAPGYSLNFLQNGSDC